jgi:SAM-dependent methyltransferase
MRGEQDAWGQLLLAALEGGHPREIIERDDGFIETGPTWDLYAAPFRRWPPLNRRAMRFVRGRVLDVGCGAGRVCLHLKERGLDVVGIDISPGAVEVCRRRGVRHVRVCPIRMWTSRSASSTRSSCSATTSASSEAGRRRDASSAASMR